jgi:NADPH-dependent curcumin reductase CurA
MTVVNRRITLAARPVGVPKVSDFDLAFTPLPSPGAGEVLVRSVYLSLDPYMRLQMDGGRPACAPPVAIGGVMVGAAVARVLAPATPGFAVGDAVEGMLGWQEYAVAPGQALRKLDPQRAELSTALGVLGMPGLTAYFGLLDICDPQPGETVVVSGAAGAVGMIAGQLAKLRGCRVVGVAGSDAKVSWLVDELGFAGALNHWSATDLAGELDALCPDGIDVYFDNVGGVITDAVVGCLNSGARIAVCGQTSQYNLERPELGPRWLGQLVRKQAKVQGFLVSAYAARFPAALEQLAGWLDEGKLKYREDVAQGIEAAPQAFIGMLQGRSQGKQLVHLAGS